MASTVLLTLILIFTSTWAFQFSLSRHIASNFSKNEFNHNPTDEFMKDGMHRAFGALLLAAAADDDSIQERKQPKSKGANKTTRKQQSKGAAKRARSGKKKASKTRTKQRSSAIPSNIESTPDSMYIQFSRVFQRHVVYQIPTNNQSEIDNPSNTPIVLQSFEFLDEAMRQYPDVTKILAPKDLPFPPPTCSIEEVNIDENGKREKDVDECETTIAGMGLTTLCELEYPFDNIHQVRGWTSSDNVNGYSDALGYRYDQSRDAIQTLLELVTTSESELNLPRHYFRLEEKRFALRGMTSDMIKSNYDKLVYLLGRVLEMKRMDVEFVLSNFPQLCLYDSEELKTMVDFLRSPLPPTEYVSVYLVADKGFDGANVDCKSREHSHALEP